jgi:hypothetical protein
MTYISSIKAIWPSDNGLKMTTPFWWSSLQIAFDGFISFWPIFPAPNGSTAKAISACPHSFCWVTHVIQVSYRNRRNSTQQILLWSPCCYSTHDSPVSVGPFQAAPHCDEAFHQGWQYPVRDSHPQLLLFWLRTGILTVQKDMQSLGCRSKGESTLLVL